MTRLNFDTTITREHAGRCFEIDLAVEVEYAPDYPPHPCLDHDHPRYADPGSGEELDILSATVRRCEDLSGNVYEWLPAGTDLLRTNVPLTSDQLISQAAEEFSDANR